MCPPGNPGGHIGAGRCSRREQKSSPHHPPIMSYQQALGWMICTQPRHEIIRLPAGNNRSEQIPRRDDQRIRLLSVIVVASTS
jgi:hypothetical protein